jgi:heme ABC exporter ATP-binding subunit CcmA
VTVNPVNKGHGFEGAAVTARSLNISFGNTCVLKNIDLNIQPGEFWVVFGPNGAGKTTLTVVLATLLKPSSGTLLIEGVQAGEADANLRRRIGVVSHQSFLYADLTARENLLFYGRLYGVSRLARVVENVLDEVALLRWADRRLRTFSRGMHRRLAIARALLWDPQILLLDEPFSGLDRQTFVRFHSLLQVLHTEQRTVVLATHDIKLGLSLSTHVALLVQGRIVYSCRREELNEAGFEGLYLRWVERTGGNDLSS